MTWDRRATTAGTERRASLYVGRAAAGAALLVRAERAADARSRDVLRLTAEMSMSLTRGVRLALEPRAGWDTGRFAQQALSARLSWPFSTLGMRLGAGLTVGSDRERNFRGGVREAELTLSLSPRARDRGDFALRRTEDSGPPALEYDAAYDLQAARYERAGGWLASRHDSSRVAVQVVRTGNRTGVADVLLTLDGREMRFTDADGWAHFDHVPEGVHLLALEERSLPASNVATGSTRVFVTIERGRLLQPVVFEVGRPERRTRF
jgi:hypothetical protein